MAPTTSKTISIIVAMNQKQVIGINNQLPWSLPNDLKYFQQKTLHNPIIMGRKTFESIGKPLPKRSNIILSTQANWQHPGCQSAKNLTDALQLAEQAPGDEVMIIGGASIYQQALEIANTIYLTIIDNQLDGDCFFPKSLAELKQSWAILNAQANPIDDQHAYSYTFYTLKRQSNQR